MKNNLKILVKYKKKWLKATLMDDLKFREVAKSKKAIEEILRVVLKDDKLKVIKTIEQRNRKAAYFHGVILDCECILMTNEIVNIEVQIAFDDNPIYRMRYNQSVLTIENSPKNKDFKYKEIPKVISIMFCEFDLFKMNEAIYEINRKVNDTDVIADNGVREIYVNLKAVAKDKKLKQLFKILTTVDYKNEEIFPELSKKKEEITNLMIGGSSMSGLTLEIYNDAKKEGRQEGIAEGMQKGIVEGKQEGFFDALKSLVKNDLLDIKIAAKQINVTEEEFRKMMLELPNA